VCLGIPGQVIEMIAGYSGQLALVDVHGAPRKVNIGMLEGDPPEPGQWILIHMGLAVDRLSADAAEETMRGLELMGRPRDADPAADPDAP
jgi:hydrogenase expression/formation protein HypC